MPTAVPVPRFRGRYAAKASSVAAMRGEVEAVARVGVTVGLTDTAMLVTISDDGPLSFPIFRADAKQGRDNAVRALEAALVEQDRISERLDRAVGTSSELGTYARLRTAGAQVTARQAQVDRSAPTG